MSLRSFFSTIADVAVRCLLVIAGLIAVPVPSIALYLILTDASSSLYSDDGPFMAGLVALVVSALVYCVLIVPFIWRKRFIGAGRPSTT